MQVFVYEYFCGRGPSALAAASLLTEGRAMLAALATDLASLPGVTPITLLAQTTPFDVPCCSIRRMHSTDEERAFRELARESAWTVVIAPECEAILTRRCRWVEEAGGSLLGPSSALVELTSDKLRTAAWLAAAGVPTPPCFPHPGTQLPAPFVIKPCDGAGSQATFLVQTAAETDTIIAAAQAAWTGTLIVQPFVPGQPASVAVLCGPAGVLPLAASAQRLSRDGRFHYLGGETPLPAPWAVRTQRLAQAAIESLPHPMGYIGVDLVLGEAEDGRGDMVIEINPRLTTSYCGLRVLADGNLAWAMLEFAAGRTVAMRWQSKTIRFSAAGQIDSRNI